ncbi:MAG: murein biosynthesis integral membrane protein MurJ [Deltaproteobacteria bacterium]|nr:murein biosynthesis integral membrane protein MurJ [Deltaproteobacteria bacterium]MCB9488452.1 murein biosynthesis integral membrane protein MurJ [Deltaproteobacteria bacterium]
MSEKRHILRAAGIVGSMTMLSRILGFSRDAMIAAYFDTRFAGDAFFAAFRIPNMLRKLFGEGALTASFIPIYTDVRAKDGEDRARELFNVAFTWLTGILSILVALGVLFSPFVVRVLTPGFSGLDEKFDLTVRLLRWMFPYALTICWVALFMGVLNARRIFFAPAFAPVLLNLSMIVTLVALYHVMETPVMALAVGVLVGGILQVGMQLPYLFREGYRPTLLFRWNDKDLRRIALLMLPALIGLSAHTLNIFVSTILASVLEAGSVGYLYYAQRMMELPLGVFAIAVGTALLPSLSTQAAARDHDGLIQSMGYAVRLVTLIMVPTSIGLYVLAEPIINVVFQRGEFDPLATAQTASALRFYALGIVFFGALRVLVPTFYALKDTLTPALVASGAVAVNILTGLLLMGPPVYRNVAWINFIAGLSGDVGTLGHDGLALANSISAVFNFSLLGWLLRRRIGRWVTGEVARTVIGSLIAGTVMAIGVGWVADKFDFTTQGLDLSKLLGLLASILTGVVLYGAVIGLWERRRLVELLRLMRRRK